MILTSSRIGTIEVSDDRVIHFNEGLLGFETLKSFVLCDDPIDAEMPFKWLVSVENPEMIFLVTDPGIFFKDYLFDLHADDQAAIGASTSEDVSVVTILTVPDDPKQITANLRGPLVVNWKTLKGRQVVLKDTNYVTKHFIFTQVPAAAAPEATIMPHVIPTTTVNAAATRR